MGKGAVLGLILAGGLARRMGGGDKGLKTIGGRPVLAHIVERMAGQCSVLALNANGDPGRFAEYGLPVLPDVVEGFAGPLAGVLTGLEWARAEHPGCDWVASIPSDAPFLPRDLVARLLGAVEAEGAEMACAASAGRRHPVVGVWPVAVADDLRRALVDEDLRKIDRFTARYRLAVAEFAADPVDPFFNANRPDDFDEAERIIAAHGATV